MFCTNCGKQLQDTLKFCTACGNPTTPMTIPHQNGQQNIPVMPSGYKQKIPFQQQININTPQNQPVYNTPVKKPNTKTAKIIGCITAALILVIILFFVIDNAGYSQSTQQRRNISSGRDILDNTSWTSIDEGNLLGLVSYEARETYDFGNGNYIYTLKGYLSFIPYSESESGTYSVSGNTVTLRSQEGTIKTGTIIGNSLTIDGTTFR